MPDSTSTRPKTEEQPLRAARQAQGLGLVEAAEAARISPGHLSRIERRLATPSPAVLLSLAMVLDLPELAEEARQRKALAWRRYTQRWPRATSQPRCFGPRNAPRPYSFARLEEVLGSEDPEALAAELRVTTRTISRLRLRGALTEAQADEYAIRAGLHPACVWPSWWSEDRPEVRP